MGNRFFRDHRYPHEVITEERLRQEFGEKLLENEEMDNITFEQYIHNCMESQGGTLSLIRPKPAKDSEFTFLIRETFEMQVTVDATDKESAMNEVMSRYDNDEYDLDRNCFAGSTFRPCCSHCHSDFDYDEDGLREIGANTEDVLLLCDRCVADMEESGELTRCECCGELFKPSQLKINPMCMNEPEFSNAQLERIDEVENAAFDYIKVLTEQPDMDWDMSLIGEIADMAADFLVSRGYKVRYPAIVDDGDGNEYIVDFHSED